MEQDAVFIFTLSEMIVQNDTEQEGSPYSYTLLKDGRVEIRNPPLNQAMIFSLKGAQLCVTNDKGSSVCYNRVQAPGHKSPIAPR